MFLRAFEPLVPRPAVFPLEPSPRPTRVFAVLAPGTGRRWCTLSTPGRDAGASAFGAALALGAAFLAEALAGAFSALSAESALELLEAVFDAAAALGAAFFAGALSAAAFAGAFLAAVALGAFASASTASFFSAFSAISRSPQPSRGGRRS